MEFYTYATGGEIVNFGNHLEILESIWDFDELWETHPEEKVNVLMMGKIMTPNRYLINFGSHYNFPGNSNLMKSGNNR